MLTNEFTPVGIDVSKATLDLEIEGKVVTHENSLKSYQEIVTTLPANSWCVMESTSTYGYRLADYLVEHGFIVSIVNPLSVKRFAQMNLKRTKTDHADAKLITEYAKIADLQKYEPSSDEINELQQLETVLEQLIKQRTALNNQSEALNQMPRPCQSAIGALEATIKSLDEQIKSIEQKMHQNAQKGYPDAYEKALSVKGIGKRTATLLITVTRGFTQFDNARQLSAYIGTCPRIIQSGSSVRGKSHICKLGLRHVRAILYMCAIAAIKYNKTCKVLYERLIAKGKAIKVALMAVVNKLIHQVFACVSKNVLFDNNYSFVKI